MKNRIINPCPIPKPLFETLENMDNLPACVIEYIDQINIVNAKKEFQLCIDFLKSYFLSKATFNSYRRDVERFLQWAWLIRKKSLKEMTRHDIRDYLTFIDSPPKMWIAIKRGNRFIENSERIRLPNPLWRPFVVNISKVERRRGKKPNKNSYQLTNKSIAVVFAILSSLYIFLQQEEYTDVNPVVLIRNKKTYFQRKQTTKITRKLSRLQWLAMINTCEEMANKNYKHERTLFLLSAFYLLGVRISELAYVSDGSKAMMGNFAPDKRGMWWYTTVGKGNKIRDIAVPDELLAALKRYRMTLDLPPLPRREEEIPLFPRITGKKGLGIAQIRNIIQIVFDQAILKLQSIGKRDEAEDLASATVHWLRHTAISSDVEFRPREHVRDDVGHENPATLELYIDVDRVARHRSAQAKKIKPSLE